MRFATLKPPEPSLLRTAAAIGVPIAATGGGPPAPRAAPVALPDEFMRGGGCFAPEGTQCRRWWCGEGYVAPVSR